MNYTKLNLLLTSILAILLFFNIPNFSYWLRSNILHADNNILEQSKLMDIEDRRSIRYGHSYRVYKQLTDRLKDLDSLNPVMLLPPDDYIREKKVADFYVIEPAMFYYLTGIKAVWINSPDVMKANWTLGPDKNNNITLMRIKNKTELQDILDVYKKYHVAL